MSRHTPGPWKIFDGWGSSKRNPIIVDSIPDVGGKCVANCICHISATNDDAAANARMIAAAPDLLDIVRRLADATTKEVNPQESYKKIGYEAAKLWAKMQREAGE